MHWHGLDHDHRRTAAGAFLVVTPMTFSGQAEIGHVGGVRAEDDAVIEAPVAQLERLENVLVLGHGIETLSAVEAI